MKMRRTLALAGSFGFGALTVFFLDRVSGRRRRALLRDRTDHILHSGSDTLESTSRDIAHRAQGLFARGRDILFMRRFRERVPDEILVARARAALGRCVSHPHTIHVTAQDGTLILTGTILTNETETLLARLSKVPGVKLVDCRLHEYESPDHVPSLQGGSSS